MRAELKVVLEDGIEKIFSGEFEKNDYKRLERRFNDFIQEYNSKYHGRKELSIEEIEKMFKEDKDFWK